MTELTRNEPQMAPLLKQFTNFVNNTAGIEKFLRLLQALSQIGYNIYIDSPRLSTQLSVARTQFALGRRYLRFFKFIEIFDSAVTVLSPATSAVVGRNGTSSTLLRLLEFAKLNCLGIYFFLESLTILDEMNIVPTTWEKGCLLEANKFWFYALALSLARCCFDLLSLVFTGSSITTIAVATTTTTPIVIINSNDNEKPKDKEKENENPQQQSPHRTSLSYHSLLKQIIIDGCDLYIPGTMVGWTHATSLQVGFMMAVSTVLAADDIWVKAQR